MNDPFMIFEHEAPAPPLKLSHTAMVAHQKRLLEMSLRGGKSSQRNQAKAVGRVAAASHSIPAMRLATFVSELRVAELRQHHRPMTAVRRACTACVALRTGASGHLSSRRCMVSPSAPPGGVCEARFQVRAVGTEAAPSRWSPCWPHAPRIGSFRCGAPLSRRFLLRKPHVVPVRFFVFRFVFFFLAFRCVVLRVSPHRNYLLGLAVWCCWSTLRRNHPCCTVVAWHRRLSRTIARTEARTLKRLPFLMVASRC